MVADSSIFDKYNQKIIFIIFTLSGICGLAYEVIWVRMLGLTLGNSIYAVSLVVAAFMAGLGLGSYLAGRFIENKANPLRIYAFLELGIGLFAIVSPFLLSILSIIYIWIGQNLTSSPLLINLFRFILAFTILLIPTICMGATLPVISKYYIRKQSKMGAEIAWLYGINTLGAMIGCLATGFILIEKLGVTGTIFAVAIINFAISATILLLGRDQTITVAVDIPKEKTKSTETETKYPSYVLLAVLIGFAVSGFVSIAYEVIWTRALGYFVGHTSYAFTSILATFLFGIGLGSLAISKFSDKAKHLLVILGIVEIAIGITAVLGMPLLGKLFYLMENKFGIRTWITPIWIKFVYSFLIMLLPTLLMGITFPLAAKIYVNIKQLGSQLGKIYAVNTAGGILGSFAAVFLFIPLVGMQTSICIMAVVNLLIGTVLINLAPDFRGIRSGILITIGSIALFGVMILFPSHHTYSVQNRITGAQSVYYKEGLNNTVEIIQRDNALDLYIDGELNASTSKSGMLVHRLLAQLPILLHPDPKSVFLVGLGSGMTAGAVLPFKSIKTIDCAEISTDIVQAASEFRNYNHDIIKSPRLNLRIEDGRIALSTERQKYDVMVTGIIHPKFNPGNAGLYSKDYYELCKSRLNNDGIMCQWIPLNALRDSEFKMIIKTFQSSFPHSSLWFEELFGGSGNYNAILIGSRMPLAIDYEKLNNRLQNSVLAGDLREVDIIDSGDILNRFMLSDDDLAAFVGSQPLITDNRPRLEFGNVETNDFANILTALGNVRKSVWPHITDLPASSEERTAIQDKLSRRDKMARSCIKADICFWQHKPNEYLANYQAAEAIAPDNVALQTQMAVIRALKNGAQGSDLQKAKRLATQGKLPEAIAIYELLMSAEPGRVDLRSDLGLLYQKAGKTDQAIALFQLILDSDPRNNDIRNNLGIAFMQISQYEKAENEFEVILKNNPNHLQAIVNLGLTYARTGRKNQAIQMLEKAQAIDPTNANIKRVLEQLKK
ncbi:MAG TPA: hypothetical protein DCZ43_06230 [candidate division Zixibacteria bacterium]|nr:hypothetical protein [candidate division Zixibacteria bacterium]